MITAEISARLTAQSLVTSGYTVLRGTMPATPDRVILLSETGGMAPQQFLNGSSTVEQPTLQVRVRGVANDYDGPRAAIERVFQGVVSWGGFTASGVHYLGLQPLQSPFWMNKDANERHEFSVNFLVRKVLS